MKTPLRQHSKDAIRMNLGQSYAKLGDDAMALQNFHAVIDDDPDGSYASQAVHRIGDFFVTGISTKRQLPDADNLLTNFRKRKRQRLPVI